MQKPTEKPLKVYTESLLAVNSLTVQLLDVGRLEMLVVVDGLALVSEVPRLVLGGMELENCFQMRP